MMPRMPSAAAVGHVFETEAGVGYRLVWEAS